MAFGLVLRLVPGATLGSETTAAITGKVGVVRRDPMAMIAFFGYHMGDYFAHWLAVGASADPRKLPRIYYVNWFRKGADGRFLWPGYGENSRVLKWIFERVTGTGAAAVPSPIGNLPAPGAIDLSGLEIPEADLGTLLRADVEGWLGEVPSIRRHFEKFGAKLPAGLAEELNALEQRLQAAAVEAGR